jgi:hypothetical protein
METAKAPNPYKFKQKVNVPDKEAAQMRPATERAG